MRGLMAVVAENPWRVFATAFLIGAGLAMDARTRKTIVLASLEIMRSLAVESAWAKWWSGGRGFRPSRLTAS